MQEEGRASGDPEQELSSEEESSVPPPPAAPPALRAGWQYVEVHSGFIVFDEPTTSLNAHCGNPAHERCHFDEKVHFSTVANRSGQGRPLGALSLWLAGSFEMSRGEHQQWKKWVCSRAAKRL